jgi:hypothetical protein
MYFAGGQLIHRYLGIGAFRLASYCVSGTRTIHTPPDRRAQSIGNNPTVDASRVACAHHVHRGDASPDNARAGDHFSRRFTSTDQGHFDPGVTSRSPAVCWSAAACQPPDNGARLNFVAGSNDDHQA